MNEIEKVKEHWDLVEKARALAAEKHHGMTDKYGNPYFEHLHRVAERVKAMEFTCVGETSEIDFYVAAAYLHDVIEDTEVMEGELIDMFPEHVEMVEAVVLLSREKGVAYSDYVMGIKNSVFTSGAIARVVKLADLFDHLMGPTPCPKSLVSRYEKSLYMLYGAK